MKGPVECGLDTLGESLAGRGGEWISNMASDVSVMKRNFYLNEVMQGRGESLTKRPSRGRDLAGESSKLVLDFELI